MKRKPPMGSICPSLIAALCSGLLVCLSPQTAAGTEDERPMVLQYQVSHSRNTDQISLIFRQETVELVVNTDFWQKEAMPRRLGRFWAFYNSELSRLKRRLERTHHYLTSTVPFLSLMDIPDLPPRRAPDPHAPRIFLGGEEVSSRHGHYEHLFGIIRSVWDHRWFCFDCASYRIEGDSIVRTTNPFPDAPSAPDDPSRYVTEFVKSGNLEEFVVFSWVSGGGESLECIQRGHSGTRMECLDSRFGLFELPMPVRDTPSASGH